MTQRGPIPGKYEPMVHRAFKVALDRTRAQLEQLILSLKSEDGTIEGGALNITRIANAAATLVSTIDGAGFSQAIDVQAQAIRDIAFDVLKEYPDELPARFSADSQAAMEMLVAGADADVTSAMQSMASSVAAMLRAAALGGVKVAELLARVGAQLSLSEAQILTISTSAMHSFAASVTIQQSKEAGVEWYVYLGPNDSVTREWCGHWVGRRGRLEDFEATSNQWGRGKQPLPVATWRGGYNCRHELTPLFGEDILKWPEGPG